MFVCFVIVAANECAQTCCAHARLSPQAWGRRSREESSSKGKSYGAGHSATQTRIHQSLMCAALCSTARWPHCAGNARSPQGYFTNPENGRVVYYVKLDAVHSDIASRTKGLKTGQSTGVIPTPSLSTTGAAPPLPRLTEVPAGALEDAEASQPASPAALVEEAGGGGEVAEAEDLEMEQDDEEDVQEEEEEEDEDLEGDKEDETAAKEGAEEGDCESGLGGREQEPACDSVPDDGGDVPQSGKVDFVAGKEGSGARPLDGTCWSACLCFAGS